MKEKKGAYISQSKLNVATEVYQLLADYDSYALLFTDGKQTRIFSDLTLYKYSILINTKAIVTVQNTI